MSIFTTKNVLIFLAGALATVLIGWAYLSWTSPGFLSVDEAAEEENGEENVEGTPNTPTGGSGAQSTSPTKVWVKDHYEYIVSLNNDTFTPGVLTIKAGETVQFVNKDNLSMRISATLQGGPGGPIVDPKTVGKGGTYSLVFTKTGKWVITNLSTPKSGSGVITVE